MIGPEELESISENSFHFKASAGKESLHHSNQDEEDSVGIPSAAPKINPIVVTDGKDNRFDDSSEDEALVDDLNTAAVIEGKKPTVSLEDGDREPEKAQNLDL